MAAQMPTIDAGSYSELCSRVICRQHHLQNAPGPISRRTRSATRRAREAQTSPARRSSLTNRLIKAQAPATGAIVKNNTRGKVCQRLAEKTLCWRRLKLKAFLESDRFRDHDGYIDLDVQEQIRQLGRLDAWGKIENVLKPTPCHAKSVERFEAARAWRPGPSPLSKVERVVTEENMEGHIGLLPGEVQEHRLIPYWAGAGGHGNRDC